MLSNLGISTGLHQIGQWAVVIKSHPLHRIRRRKMITYVHLELRQIYCSLEIVVRGNSTVMITHDHYLLPNYNSTKVYFVYFGIYSGQTPDKRKAWVRFLSEVRRRGQAEMLNQMRESRSRSVN